MSNKEFKKSLSRSREHIQLMIRWSQSGKESIKYKYAWKYQALRINVVSLNLPQFSFEVIILCS
jgi:hypothetical protein